MVEYVNKAHCNSQNDYGIPFAYKSSLIDPLAKFHSMNSEDSPAVNDILKDHINSGGIMGALTGLVDNAYIL